MKITMEYEGIKAPLEDENAIDICDAIDLAEKAFWKVGFNQRRIEGGFIRKAREIEQTP